MCPTIANFHPVQGRHFGKNELQKSRIKQQFEAHRGFWRLNDLIQFRSNSFGRNDLDALFIGVNRLKRGGFNYKIKLGGKTNGPHHAQGVVRKSFSRIQGRTDDFALQITQTVKRIDNVAKISFVQTNGQCINGEIASILIVFQTAILYGGLARIVAIGLLAGPYKFHFQIAVFDHCGTKTLKNGNAGYRVQFSSNPLRQFYSTAYTNDIDVFGSSGQQAITHITTHHIGRNLHFCSCLTNDLQDLAFGILYLKNHYVSG